MKEKELKTEEKMVIEKTKQICSLLDGLKIPEVLMVLGNVIIYIVGQTSRKHKGFDEVAIDWMQRLAEEIKGCNFNNEGIEE